MLNAASDVDGAVHTQVWFGPAARPLAGWVSVPAGGQARGGVVLCPPMGEEGRAVHRTYRRLAETLAGLGLVALRLDYDGTGDSAGRGDEPDRVPAWLGSIDAARDHLLDLGVPTVAAVGMRLGATLAAHRAAHWEGAGTAFGSLVLWDPCLSGRTFLREGQALHSFGDHLAVPDDGRIHTPGFQYDAGTSRGLRPVDFARLPERPLADRVLLLSRDDRPRPEAVLTRLEHEGGRLATDVALDQDRLLDLPPSDCLVPERALARVADWLAAGVADQPPVPVKVPDGPRPALVGSGGPGSAPVRERLVRIGRVGLVGMVTEPVGDVADDEPWVVLLNVAAEHYLGPGRQWVEWARAWAGGGRRTLRVDLSGIGDSPAHPGQTEDEPFAPQWLDDTSDLVAELSAGGAPVVFVGLCSGAYSAFESALHDPVAGVLAINPRLTLYGAAKGTALHTSRRRAAIVPHRPLARLAERHRVLAGGLWRIYRQLAVWHAPYRVLHRLVRRRGTAVRLLACREDARHFLEVLAWRPALARLRRDPRFDLEVDDVFDHSLLTAAGQRAALERATDFLDRVAPPSRPGGTP